ncbi:hypothetical protein ASPCAL14917 [Aspergillus calidoustus]|uniref:Uncharacterized protein n=1 Tax=Aspergillus calidoustus TaxID=454130 RepID=A0A0U5GKH4_ASPCI|nr:hypothetical protein ASPCAL14917 [Aspergillus calidoustus]
MVLTPTSSNIAKKRVPTQTIKRPIPQVRPSKQKGAKTAAADPPKEDATEKAKTKKTLVTASCACESFPEMPDLIEVTITIWPVEFEQVDSDVDVKLDVYVYTVDPDTSSPELCHGETRRSALPPLERLGSFDPAKESDFLDAAEEALEELIKQMSGDWDDDPENFRDAFVEEMKKAGWVN